MKKIFLATMFCLTVWSVTVLFWFFASFAVDLSLVFLHWSQESTTIAYQFVYTCGQFVALAFAFSAGTLSIFLAVSCIYHTFVSSFRLMETELKIAAPPAADKHSTH